MGTVTLVYMELSPEPVDLRGWTLQEQLLSTRTIEYGTWQTRWICRESQFDESSTDGWTSRREGVLDASEVFVRIKKDGGPSSDWDCIYSWARVVEAFTELELTVSTDRPLAISGIAALFASDMHAGEYLAGLWKRYIRHGLLWNVEPDAIVAPPAVFQGLSWSWTAVNGPVKYRHAASGLRAFETVTLRVLSYHRDLMDDDAPFGALQPNSAILKVRGRLVPAILRNTLGCRNPEVPSTAEENFRDLDLKPPKLGGNVLDKRATRISERPPFHYPLNAILHCSTTTLGTNDNYIRSS
jgi:hypothetical protein